MSITRTGPQLIRTEEEQALLDGTFCYIMDRRSIAQSASNDWLIRTGANKIQISFDITPADKCDIQAFDDDTTITATGTGLVERNFNRAEADSATVAFFHAPTINVIGTEIANTFITANASLGANTGLADTLNTGSFILDANSDYIFRITNTSSGTAEFVFFCRFTEKP